MGLAVAGSGQQAGSRIHQVKRAEEAAVRLGQLWMLSMLLSSVYPLDERREDPGRKLQKNLFYATNESIEAGKPLLQVHASRCREGKNGQGVWPGALTVELVLHEERVST